MNNAIFRALNKVPGVRKILSPIFSFFFNFDDLWLYNYHPRQYNTVFQSLLDTINDIEDEKWELIPFQKIVDWLGF